MKDILRGIVYVGLFAVPFLTLYVANENFFPYITGKNFWFRIIVEVVVGAYIILALLDKTVRPRFSWILATFGALIAVMLITTLQAEHVSTAFWSNFERMDGYVTLIHVFFYFLVLGSVFQSPKIWTYFLNTTVAVAALVALQGVAQLSGSTTRVDSTLGNAAYMAVYMLFHIFILALLFVRTNVVPYRVIYVLLGILFVFVLLQTGTRGTAIGLATGSLAAVSYIVLFAARYPQVRRYALFGVVSLVLLFGGFYSVRDSAYIQETPALARIANIDLGNDLRIRSIIWGMSVEGVKERPVFGWGHGNFNYVFNEQYDPRLYAQEQWFDRVHNIVFDWLIAGGVVGLVAYFSIFAALFYYLVIRAWRGDSSVSLMERGILVGLIVGYITHNLVVFDNIVSYIFFAVTLAYIHSRYSQPWGRIDKVQVPAPIVTQIVAPLVLVLVCVTVYVVNVPGMKAATGIIDAFRTQDVATRLTIFEEILALDSFAQQEIVEQLAQQAMSLAQNPGQVSPELQTRFLEVTERELQKMVEAKPGDARLHVFLASYYRAIGDAEKARGELVLAREFSPNKQAIILQQGAVEIGLGDNNAAREFFKTAYELDTTNDEAREYYYASLLLTGDTAGAAALIETAPPAFSDRLAVSDFVFNALNQAQQYEDLARLYETRVTLSPDNAQQWASLAYVYYQMAQQASTTDSERRRIMTDKAIETLSRGAAAVPSFAPTAECVSGNLKAGRAPEAQCL
jgi:O-antigen ligase/tetratricopeptide (TPR) repeat protein